MSQKKDLLDILWKRIGCEYLSDLKSARYLVQVPNAIRNDEIASFPLEAYEELASYLYGDSRTFSDYSDVIQYLNTIRKLMDIFCPSLKTKKDCNTPIFHT